MSHFCRSQTSDAEASEVFTSPGGGASAFVWGGASGQEYGKILDLWSAEGNVRITANVSTPPGNWIVSYTIPSVHVGKTFIGVKPGTSLRETMNSIVVRVGASEALAAARTEVMNNVRSGRIRGIGGELAATQGGGAFTDKKGRRIYLADDMWFALAALSRANPVTIMSMMRFGEGYHGSTEGRTDGSALCSAMDIQNYAGFELNLINGANVETTISGVAAIIGNLPQGRYGYGLTRPSTMAGGPYMPEKDVFLPCSTSKPMYSWGSPLEDPTPSFVNADATQRVHAAMIANPRAVTAQMFMDGPDHVHLHVWSARA